MKALMEVDKEIYEQLTPIQMMMFEIGANMLLQEWVDETGNKGLEMTPEDAASFDDYLKKTVKEYDKIAMSSFPGKPSLFEVSKATN